MKQISSTLKHRLGAAGVKTLILVVVGKESKKEVTDIASKRLEEYRRKTNGAKCESLSDIRKQSAPILISV